MKKRSVYIVSALLVVVLAVLLYFVLHYNEGDTGISPSSTAQPTTSVETES